MRQLLVQSEHLAGPASHALLLVVAFAAALVVSLLAVRFLRPRASALGLAEAPRHLAESAPSVAKVGGIGIALSIAVVGPLLWLGFGEMGLHSGEAGPLLAVLAGASVMVLLGTWDDLRELRARTKLVVQVVAAVAVWTAGVRFGGFAAPGGLVHLLPAASLVVTVFWFVALTNAFNLVDGADGVAGGAALTAILAMFVVSIFLGQSMAAYVLAVAAGAVIGFLFYNFPPASVYLGDAGSLALGFLLAGVGLVTSAKATTLLAVAIPVVSLGLPIMDTTLAVIRRTIRGESIARRDEGHIHHRLARLGHSPRTVALLLFAASGVLALASLLLLSPDLRLVGLVYAVLGVVAFVGLQRLRMPELLDLRRAIVRGIRAPGESPAEAMLRQSLEAIEARRSSEDKVRLLAELLQQMDFVEAEIRVKDRRRDSAPAEFVYWRWAKADSLRTEADWETHGPLFGQGGRIGSLSLRRPWNSSGEPALGVLTHELAPALGLVAEEPHSSSSSMAPQRAPSERRRVGGND